MRFKRLWIAVAGLGMGLASIGAGAGARASAGAADAGAVKDFSLPQAKGGEYSLASRRGHRVVISFYKGFF